MKFIMISLFFFIDIEHHFHFDVRSTKVNTISLASLNPSASPKAPAAIVASKSTLPECLVLTVSQQFLKAQTNLPSSSYSIKKSEGQDLWHYRMSINGVTVLLLQGGHSNLQYSDYHPEINPCCTEVSQRTGNWCHAKNLCTGLHQFVFIFTIISNISNMALYSFQP